MYVSRMSCLYNVQHFTSPHAKIRKIQCFFLPTEMDGCADDRSLTPPLTNKLIATKLKENGKPMAATVHKKDDQTNKSRANVMSSIANKL